MEKSEVGVFIDFWDGNPNHLPFLNLSKDANSKSNWNLDKSIQLLNSIMSQSSNEDIEQGINLLLNDHNWRCHIVALFAILKVQKNIQKRIIPLLWKRLEKGSWVSPQILVILSMIDEDFNLKALKIIEEGIKIEFSDLPMHEYHSFRGPDNINGDEQKVISAINGLLKERLDDNSGGSEGMQIAVYWKSNLQALIDEGKIEISKD